ncbi:DNA mismatch repair protein MutT [Dactylosporangium sucinum]|uniref:8-oxo-dGTP diphosphatase n=1 Tax=Dactylosporangium sucinum TaxID=1424081 RepID=A0A917WRU8_9ACTN|nr:DNA mismatch repair protein MutT [Dactylosporangium sucinum]
MVDVSEVVSPRIVVAAAIIMDGRVLAGERAAEPVTLAGMWEFPGGKVEPGETEPEALERECREELGVAVDVGRRVGADAPIQPGRSVLRVYTAVLRHPASPSARQHRQLRWLSAAELATVPWLHSDATVLPAIATLLLAAQCDAAAGINSWLPGRVPRPGAGDQPRSR